MSLDEIDGGSVRISSALTGHSSSDRPWSSEDFADAFLMWVAERCPTLVGKWVSVTDLECELFPRFQLDGECLISCSAPLRAGWAR